MLRTATARWTNTGFVAVQPPPTEVNIELNNIRIDGEAAELLDDGVESPDADLDEFIRVAGTAYQEQPYPGRYCPTVEEWVRLSIAQRLLVSIAFANISCSRTGSCQDCMKITCLNSANSLATVADHFVLRYLEANFHYQRPASRPIYL